MMAGVPTAYPVPDETIRELGLVPFVDEHHGMAGLIAPRFGAELASLCVRWQGRWVETLYRAGQYKTPPPFWRGRAPLLWPAVGRHLIEADVRRARATGQDPSVGSYRVGDRVFPMPTHGFAMDMAWEAMATGDGPGGAIGTWRLRDTAQTRRWYPFAFELSVTHATGPWGLRSTYTVLAGAPDLPGQLMPMTIGNHLSLLMPPAGRGRFDDVLLYSPGTGYRGLEHPSLFDGREYPFQFGGVPLADRRLHNMVTCGYRWEAAQVALWGPESFGFVITQRILETPGGIESLAPEQSCFFVFWSEPAEGYFCPEPWVGGPNALNTLEGAIRLAPGERFVWQMEIRPIFQPPQPSCRG